MLKGLSPIEHPNQLCEGSLMSKQFHKSFPKESTPTTNTHKHIWSCSTMFI
jgi:hypothetical protein